MASSSFSASSLFGLENKVALVTGGGSGIGLMIARGLATNGATVYIGGRRKGTVEKAAEQYGSGLPGSIHPIELDVTSKDSLSKAAEFIGSKHQKLDILINNAGQVGPRSAFLKDPSAPEMASPEKMGEALLSSESFDEWGSLFQINVAGVYFTTVAFIGLLDAASKADEDFSASVINITSISGTTKLAQAHFAYNASKAAANHITRMLSTEFALKKVKVRVNAIGPGLFPSEMTNKQDGEFNAEETTKYSGAIVDVPAGRSGRPEEMAGTAVYLASKAGRYTNGQVLVVDGGWIAVNPAAS